MARTPSALPSPDEIVAREQPKIRPATFAAVAASGLTAIAVVIDQIVSAKVPDFDRVNLIETLSAASSGDPQPKSFLTAVGQFKLDHSAALMGSATLRAIAFALMVPLVLLLMRAARERGGQLAKFLEPLAGAGLVLMAIGTFAFAVLEPGVYRDARDAGFSPEAIRNAVDGSVVFYAQIPTTIGSLMIGVPLALGALQAYRIGLIPPVLGFMGVLVGMLFVLPFDQTGLLRAIWFGAVAWVVAGRMPTGTPPAWTTGEAVVAGPRQPPEPRAPKGKGKGGKPAAAKASKANGTSPKLTK